MISLGMLIETMVAILLVITIGYCMLLNRRLKGLRGDEAQLRATIAELMTASENAERAMHGLRAVAAETDETLGGRLRRAGELNVELDRRIQDGQDIVRRIAQIAEAARGNRAAAKEEPAAAEIGDAAAESAQRLSEFRRSRLAGAAA